MSRRGPPTDPEDLALWERVAASARPLRPRPPKEAKDRPGQPARQAAKPAATPRLALPEPKPRPPAPPPLHPIDRRTMSRINRGAAPIDARIDLHGLTQAEAHARLAGFLRDAQARGARMALVITGKGIRGEAERGVLRRSVPHWLASPELRPLVIGFEEAGRAHGGSGALLVRLRRAR